METPPESALYAIIASVVDEGVAAGRVHADASDVTIVGEVRYHFFLVDGHIHLPEEKVRNPDTTIRAHLRLINT